MTSELQQNRYDRLVRRVGGIIGVGSKVNEVLSELFPMIDVENQHGELQLLKQTTLGMAAGLFDADVGERPKVQLFNPTNSGRIATITLVAFSNSSSGVLRIARTTIVQPNSLGTELARDTRVPLTDRPSCSLFAGGGVANVDANMFFAVNGSNITQYIRDENGVMILAPGTGIEVGSETTGGVVRVTFLWRERTAEQSELNF